jgi:uncharacterized membrane protein
MNTNRMEAFSDGVIAIIIKGKISMVIYVVGITLSFVNPWIGLALYVLVAVVWLIPDRRIERKIS